MPSRRAQGLKALMHRSQIGGVEVSAIGKAVAALHPDPEAAIGKTVLCFGAVEIPGDEEAAEVNWK
jgi:hypothetical protein